MATWIVSIICFLAAVFLMFCMRGLHSALRQERASLVRRATIQDTDEFEDLPERGQEVRLPAPPEKTPSKNNPQKAAFPGV